MKTEPGGYRKKRAAMSARGPVRGKVARVLNTREVVINRGTADGVTKGMTFAILDPNLEQVVDPDSGDVLGSVERPKVLVRAVEVLEKLTVAKTFRYRLVGGSALLGVAGLFEPRRKVYDSFESTEQTWTEIAEEDSYVKTGDPVKEVDYEDDATIAIS